MPLAGIFYFTVT